MYNHALDSVLYPCSRLCASAGLVNVSGCRVLLGKLELSPPALKQQTPVQ